jgi:hypothetical protein
MNMNQNVKKGVNTPVNIRNMIQVLFLLTMIVVTSCQPVSSASRPPISATEVNTIAASYNEISNAYIQAWNTHDTENMRPLLTDDVIYYEPSNNPSVMFIDNLLGRNAIVLSENPNIQGQQAGLFINRDSAFDIWEMWGYSEVDGYLSSAEDPISAFDWYTLRDGKIATMWLFWEAGFLETSFNVVIHEQPLLDYEKAWSSGDSQEVADLYAPEAVLHDSLFGPDLTGPAAIQEFAAQFFTWYPGVSFTRQIWFQLGESRPVKVGGVYTIHVLDQAGDPCDIQAIILLEAPVISATSTDKLINEWLFYEPDSLIACGWAQ